MSRKLIGKTLGGMVCGGALIAMAQLAVFGAWSSHAQPAAVQPGVVQPAASPCQQLEEAARPKLRLCWECFLDQLRGCENQGLPPEAVAVCRDGAKIGLGACISRFYGISPAGVQRAGGIEAMNRAFIAIADGAFSPAEFEAAQVEAQRPRTAAELTSLVQRVVRGELTAAEFNARVGVP